MSLKNYFENLKSSISSFDYYFKVIKSPLKNSILFVLSTLLLLGIVDGAYKSFKTLPFIKVEVENTINSVAENFDPSLEIIWADNQLEINKESLFIPWPNKFDYQEYSFPEHIAIISNNDSSPNESDLLKSTSTSMFINKNNLYTLQETVQDFKDNQQNNLQNTWSEYPLREIFADKTSFSLNKQNLPKILEPIKTDINANFQKIQILMFFVFTIIYIASKIWFLLIESLLVFLLFKIYGFNFNLNKIFILTGNILVPAAIIELISKYFYANQNFPMLMISFWTILTVIGFKLSRVDKKST
ncbi:DUF1189 family protein [Candidatus Woesebacteria bacterium]|nr:DUF1189 family protein [Candidatus Woesebacteria bacterium]